MTSRVLVSLRVRATPDRAFQVFTHEIGSWWKPDPLFQFTQSQSGVLRFEPFVGGRFIQTSPEGQVFEIGRINVWDPGVRLVFTWRQATFAPDQRTEVEIRFEPVGAETRVTVEHSGWDTIPADHVARHGFPDRIFLLRHAEWWQAQLDSLRGAAAR
jgi:uncharacterized protein YndB with AHSA1/START domain